jgi:hypothetical protein
VTLQNRAAMRAVLEAREWGDRDPAPHLATRVLPGPLRHDAEGCDATRRNT